MRFFVPDWNFVGRNHEQDGNRFGLFSNRFVQSSIISH